MKKKRSTISRFISHFLQNTLCYILIFLTNIFSVRTSQKLGQKIGRFGFYVAKKERKKAFENLRFCFPDQDSEWIESTARKSFESAGETLFEVLSMKKIARNPSQYTHFEDIELLLEQQASTSCVLLFAHYGNWEIISMIPQFYQIPSIAIASPLSSANLNRLLIQQRENKMMDVILKNQNNTARKLVQAIKQKKMMIFGIDLDSKIPSTFVPFFGRSTKTPVGPAKIALKSQLPVFFALGGRDENGVHHIKIHQIALPPHEEQTVEELTTTFSLFLEQQIKQDPEYWIWFNNRWKSSQEN